MKRALILLCALTSIVSSCVSDEEVLSSREYIELQKRVASAEKKVTEAAGKISALEQKIDDHSSTIGSDSPASLNSSIESLKVDLDTATSDEKKWSAERDRLRSEVESFKKTDPAFQFHLSSQVDLAVAAACNGAIDALWNTQFDFSAAQAVISGVSVNDLGYLSTKRDPQAEAQRCYDDRYQNRFLDDAAARCSNLDSGQLAKSPARFVGTCMHGFGRVVQFDSNTGPCTFHANIGDRRSAWYIYDLRAQFGVTNDPDTQSLFTFCDWLSDIEEDTEIEFWAFGVGSYSYSTTLGGTNTIPAFHIVYVRY